MLIGLLVLSYGLVCDAQFFTKTQKSVPRMGRRSTHRELEDELNLPKTELEARIQLQKLDDWIQRESSFPSPPASSTSRSVSSTFPSSNSLSTERLPDRRSKYPFPGPSLHQLVFTPRLSIPSFSPSSFPPSSSSSSPPSSSSNRPLHEGISSTASMNHPLETISPMAQPCPPVQSHGLISSLTIKPSGTTSSSDAPVMSPPCSNNNHSRRTRNIGTGAGTKCNPNASINLHQPGSVSPKVARIFRRNL